MRPTVINLLNLGERYLKKAGVLSHRASSERLLEHAMQCRRIDLYLERSVRVEHARRKKFFLMLKERARRYPLQYLLKEAHFMDFSFEVDESCLIPRPETELLVEHVRADITRDIPSGEVRILDLGTGSGNIALSLARYLPFAEIWAVDISERALATAKRNAERLGVGNRIRFFQSDLFSAIPDGTKFECIVSNPPYLSAADLRHLEGGDVVFEPREALLGGPKGTELLISLIGRARTYLAQDGLLAFEMGMGQAAVVREELENLGYENTRIVADYAGIERIGFARWSEWKKSEARRSNKRRSGALSSGAARSARRNPKQARNPKFE